MFFYLVLIVVLFYYFTDRYKIGGKPYTPKDPQYENRHRISFHFYSSPTGVDWASPLAIFLSTLKNLVHPYNRLISHVAVELQSPSSYNSEAPYYEFTSMTDRGKDEFKNLFRDQIGLGVLITNYRGKMECASMLQRETQKKRRQGRVQTVTYFISEASAHRLQKYLAEYKEFGVDKVYGGLKTNPRELKGAGCVPFSKSFAEISGLDKDPFQKNWDKVIRIPKILIGKRKKRKKVPITKILFGPYAKRWANEDEPHKKIIFWDVDRIFQSLAEYGEYLSRKSDTKPELFEHCKDNDLKVIERNKSYEFLFDRSELNPPNDPIWLK